MTKPIVSRLLKIAKKNKLTAVEFCIKAGIRKNAISDWKNNPNRNPSIDALISICDSFSLNMNWLTTGKGEMYLDDYGRAACITCDPSEADAKEVEKLRRELADTKQQVAVLQSQLGELKGKNADLSEQLIERLKELLTKQEKLSALAT